MVQGKMVPGGAGPEALQEAFVIREEVFVHEQGYAAELDRDDIDERAAHVIVYEDGTPVSTARLYLDDAAQWHIGRVAVRKMARGKGYGDLAMRLLLQAALGFGAEEVLLGSQEHAVGFYGKLGFEVCGPLYLDEGEPHLPMVAKKEALLALFAGCAGCQGCEGGAADSASCRASEAEGQ